MAIYKPSNCSPYLSTIDLFNLEQLPHYFECKLDTSNTSVTAYSIVIYDEDNNQVFPINNSGEPSGPSYSYVSDLQTGASNLNSGLNGSYLKIPFIQEYSGTATALDANALYVKVDGGLNLVLDANGKTISINNGYSYKWVITLYQGVTKGESGAPVMPSDYYSFDMIITSGQIMGTTNERIQSVLSENIYVDYFIQPVNVNGFSLDPATGQWGYTAVTGESPISVANYYRVRVKNYDSSYGYIYPQTGDYGFPDTLFSGENRPNAFQIYKMGNDTSILTATQKVNLVGACVIPWEWVSMPSNESTSYALQTYYVPEDAYNSEYYYPFDVVYDGDFEEEDAGSGAVAIPVSNRYVLSSQNPITYGVQVGDRIVLNYQLSTNESYDTAPSSTRYPNNTNGSAFNGIFTITPENNPTLVTINGDNYYKIVLRWSRTSDANTWGSLINKVVYVEGGDQTYALHNIQPQQYDDSGKPVDNNSVFGEINKTVLMFVDELPIQIYSYSPIDETDIPTSGEVTWDENSYRNTTAPIFYNQDLVINSGEVEQIGRLYVRPFVGLSSNMWFQYILPNSNGYNFIITTANTEFWYVEFENVRNGRTTTSATDLDVFTIGERYQIRSFYRIGDEIPFNCADTPEVSIAFYSSSDMGTEYEEIVQNDTYLLPDGTPGTEEIPSGYVGSIGVTSRTIYCYAQYSQTQNIQWENFQWRLYDANGNLLDESEIIYSGKIEYYFYGLLYRSAYLVELVVENYSGISVTLTQNVYTIYGEIANSVLPINLSLDCDMAAVVFDFTGFGYILPNQNGQRIVSSIENNTEPAIPGVSYSDGFMNIGEGVPLSGVYYDKVSSSYLQPSSTSPIVTSSNDLTLQGEHTFLGDDFEGIIFQVGGTPSANTTEANFTFSALVPSMFTSSGVPNSNRSSFEYSLTNNSTQITQTGIFTIVDNPNPENHWMDGNHLIFASWGPWSVSASSSKPQIGPQNDQGEYKDFKVSFLEGAVPWILGQAAYDTGATISFSNMEYGFDSIYYYDLSIETTGSYPSTLPEKAVSQIQAPLRSLSLTASPFNVMGTDGTSGTEFLVASAPGGSSWVSYYTQIETPVLWSDYGFQAENVVIGVSMPNTGGDPSSIETGLESDISNPQQGYVVHYVGMNLLTNNIWTWEDDDEDGNPLYWDDGVASSENGVSVVYLQLQNEYDYNYEKPLLMGKNYLFNTQLSGLSQNTVTVVKAEAYPNTQGGSL